MNTQLCKHSTLRHLKKTQTFITEDLLCYTTHSQLTTNSTNIFEKYRSRIKLSTDDCTIYATSTLKK